MKNNPKLLIILGGVAVVIIIGFLWSLHGSSSEASHRAQTSGDHQAFDVASGDTNNEVLKSIVARQKALQDKNARLEAESTRLQQELAAKSSKALEQSELKIQQELAKTRASLEAQIHQAQDAVHLGHSQQSSNLEYQVGHKGAADKNNQMIQSAPDLSAAFDGQGASTLKHSNLEPTQSGQDSPTLPSDSVSTSPQQNKKVVPYYTIPDGATIGNTVLLSPLIGEVPVNGALETPAFPFKAMISHKDMADMFSANGVPLPSGITGMVLQGYAVGNMSLGCTRAYVMKVLFVFNDGHFVVFPEDKEGNQNSATAVYPKDAIGYLSDAYNNACINGKYITDAPKVIGSLATLGGVAGAGGAIAQSQTDTITSFSQGTSGSIFNGNLGKYALGNGIGMGAKAALDWYKARVNDIFDAVFVPSTQHGNPRQLVFNITKTIPIDLNQKGRTLSYENHSHFSGSDTSFE